MTHATCPDCGMSGSILPVPWSESETGYAADLHVYQCGTRNTVNRVTGELDDKRSRRSPACIEVQRLRGELATVQEQNRRLIAERDGQEQGDEPY